MRNITELRGDLLVTYEALKSGTIQLKDAAERNNTAGKVFQSLKVELTYCGMRGEIPDIEFLHKPGE